MNRRNIKNRISAISLSINKMCKLLGIGKLQTWGLDRIEASEDEEGHAII
jgi:hypothetical protein